MKAAREEKKKIGGIRMRAINWSMLILTFALAAFLFSVSLYVEQEYAQVAQSAGDHMHLESQADIVHEASEYLTSEVRMFVVTADLLHARQYFRESNVTRRREAALAELTRQGNVSYEGLQKAVEASNTLMEREIYAMKLVCVACGYAPDMLPAEVRDTVLSAEDAALDAGAMQRKAQTLVFDQEYQRAKDEIYGSLERFTQSVLTKTKEQFDAGQKDLLRAVRVQRGLLYVLVGLIALFAAAVAYLVMAPLRIYLHCIKNQTLLKASGAYEFRYLAKVYNDISTQKDASVAKEAAMKHRAEHDLMTGLLNRVSAEDQVQRMMAASETPGILILLDLDDLKGINDVFGHKAGDRAILGIAETLKSHFRDSDVIGRLGGDEFLVYLSGAAKKRDAIALSLDSLRQKLSAISVDTAESRHIHCSIGCAVQTDPADTYESLFKRADTALYHVKRGQKNGFAFYVPEMEQKDYEFRSKKLLTKPGGQKFETEQLQAFLTAMATFYQLILSVNLQDSTYYIMQEVTDGIFSRTPATGFLNDFLRLAGQAVHPDDAGEYYARLSGEGLMGAYQSGKSTVHHYFRFLRDGGYRWIECTVVFCLNGQGDICDFTLLRWADDQAEALNLSATQ